MEELALERINILFDEAGKAANEGRMDDANRYVQLARTIGMRYNVRLTSAQKRRICRQCHAYLVPGVNLRVRFSHGTIVSTCKCGEIMRRRVRNKKEKNQNSKQADA